MFKKISNLIKIKNFLKKEHIDEEILGYYLCKEIKKKFKDKIVSVKRTENFLLELNIRANSESASEDSFHTTYDYKIIYSTMLTAPKANLKQYIVYMALEEISNIVNEGSVYDWKDVKNHIYPVVDNIVVEKDIKASIKKQLNLMSPDIKKENFDEDKIVSSMELGKDSLIYYVVDKHQNGNILIIGDDYLNKWGVTIEEVDSVAKDNLDELPINLTTTNIRGSAETNEFEVGIAYDDEQNIKIVTVSSTSSLHLSASTILCPRFWKEVSKELNTNEIYVSIPNPYVVYAFAKNEDDLIMRELLKSCKDFYKSTNSNNQNITDEIFLVTRDGISRTEL